uniref:histone H2B variant L1-like n=1 Tax=Jaculus jaculus TaxID=51337 RepID=UPI001E1B398A|nr:histone H2B variant L1-like [Jaculus jaculus]
MARSSIKRFKYSKGHLSPVSRKTSCYSSVNFGHGNYSRYINWVLKEVVPDSHIASRTLYIMNMLINDLFERIATEARHLMHSRNRCTLTPQDIQKAVYLLLPRKLAKYAVTFGSEAVHRFVCS